MKIDKKVKYIRETNSMSQSQFAEKLGLSRSYLAGVENGFANVTPLFAHCVSLMFSVPYDWLFDDTQGIEDIPPCAKPEHPEMTDFIKLFFSLPYYQRMTVIHLMQYMKEEAKYKGGSI